MATHDYNLANQDGASFRSDLNNALAAIVSNNSSSTAPATTFAHQIWVDTTANVIKQRNAANDAWIELWRIDGGFNAKTFSSNVTLNAQSDLRFADSDSSNWVAFQAPATVASNVTWTLPSADGTADQALTTNGSGVLSWADAGGVQDNITEGNTSAEVVDTGSDGHFKVVTEGTEALRVDSSQRVGIGINSPAQNLHIASTSSTTQRISRTGLADGNASDAAVIEFANGTGAVAELRSGGDGDLQINTRALSTDSYNNSLFVKGSTGNVGIGTTSPNSQLNVSAAENAAIELTSTSGGPFRHYIRTQGNDLQVRASSGIIAFYTGNTDGLSSTERARIDSSGNFKINSGYGSVATAYGVRAWVNFNGTGTVAIRDSGNVSSITDNGTGDYTVNLSTAMPDTNFAAMGSSAEDTGGGFSNDQGFQIGRTAFTTSTFRICTANSAGTAVNHTIICAAVFR